MKGEHFWESGRKFARDILDAGKADRLAERVTILEQKIAEIEKATF